MDKRKLDVLRQRAEESDRSGDKDISESSGNDLRSALHEFHSYQIELDLQARLSLLRTFSCRS